jgi:putative ABC transport system permease protein
MDAVDIPISSLVIAFFLLVIPGVLDRIYGLGLLRSILSSVARMSVQLFLIGIFFMYLFEWNNAAANLLWLAVMILFAVHSAIRSASMKFRSILPPVFLSFSASTLSVLLYINYFVIRLDYVFDARYLVVLGGMLLGNSLRGNIIGIDSFYHSISNDSKRHRYILSLGATMHEAVLPYLRESVSLAMKPTIASMATMGIVFLPGMMTGVILGGAEPAVAVKYQVVIMLAITAGTFASVILTILLTRRFCFTGYGTLKKDIFAQKKRG